MNGADLTQIDHHKFGFREIFRVAVPGVWVLLCLLFLSSPIWRALDYLGVSVNIGALSVFELIILAVAFGLFCFSLQLPRRLKPYRTAVKHLRNFMLQFSGKDSRLVDKPAYDYLMDNFLPPGATWRIHYFASLYYMFMDVALISATWFVVVVGFSAYSLLWSYPDLSGIVTMVVLGMSALVATISARRFLTDVQLFSMFCLMANKEKLAYLIACAQESDALSNMEDALTSGTKLGRTLRRRR